MGQSASRQQVLTPPSPATASTVSTSNNEIVSEDSVDDIPEPVSRPRRRSARSSVRRSILNLVKPRSSQQSEPSTPRPSNSRKSWRTSKRWSKAAPALVPDDVPSPSTSRLSPPPPITEKEPEQPIPAIDANSGESSQQAPEPEQPQDIPHSPDIGQWFNDDDSPDERVVISPDSFALPPQDHLPDVPEDVSPPPTINHPDQPAVLPQPPSPRQFPPPGTLVVVQGVVHTTDVPRPPVAEPLQDVPEPVSLPSRGTSVPPRSPTPASLNTDRPGARNRLSALLRSRPSSMVSSAELAPEPVSETGDTPAETTENTITQPTPSGSISSSSIDVLGTLLSVAAAATAASLLTGSSEPILSSGLTPPTPTGSAPPLNDQNIRPMSPTPTSGSSDAMGGRTERMRQAWASIRERLGIRPPRSSDRNDDRADAGDARERMLAEMARAFNLGLGINSPSTDGSTPADSPEPALPLPQLPAEGTFERFLIDLQLDLRTTLTQRQDEAENEAPHQPELPEIPSSDWDAIPVPSPAPVTSPPPLIHDVPAEEDENMPELEDVSDSDSDSHFSSDSVSVHNDDSTTPSSSVHASPLQTSVPQAPELPPRPTDRINWWRLYRFPAIAAPRGGSSFDVNLRPPTATPAPSVTAPTENASMFTLDSSSPSDASTPPSDPSSSNPPQQNVVVPVIVVGLQSVHVNMDWRPPPGEQEGDIPHEDDAPLHDVQEPRPDTPRGRRWHSRAASALRNLRPGRRAEVTGGHPAELDPTGSRTFLIYVIGGYYPPDHSIVTGEPNNLDSFEALLDLAEILGQVKPPTASKEEIEKSNLEVIKAARLKEYEELGKISSNCTERCLICLDDYAEDDEVRVMVCRHAFHKGCVDMWLQTGKNNCPACRGAGVSTDESSIAPSQQ